MAGTDPKGSISMAQDSNGMRPMRVLEAGLVSTIQQSLLGRESSREYSACDWWHGVPQLFWKNVFYETELNELPSSCASVNLVAVEL